LEGINMPYTIRRCPICGHHLHIRQMPGRGSTVRNICNHYSDLEIYDYYEWGGRAPHIFSQSELERFLKNPFGRRKNNEKQM